MGYLLVSFVVNILFVMLVCYLMYNKRVERLEKIMLSQNLENKLKNENLKKQDEDSSEIPTTSLEKANEDEHAA